MTLVTGTAFTNERHLNFHETRDNLDDDTCNNSPGSDRWARPIRFQGDTGLSVTTKTSSDPSPASGRTYVLKMRHDLQGMRAVAVLAVFADHLFGWPSGGFVGVDVFFVLSGFFITGLLIGERTHTGKLSFRKFYTRRARRILPSALLVITVTVLASYLLLTGTRAKEALIDGLWAAIFLSNWRFERVGTDYFAVGQPDSPLLHYWSLSIEEQFYFVWPVLLFALFALTRRLSGRGRRYSARRQFWITAAMAAICAASFTWGMVESASHPTAAYFSTGTRIWELGVGALLAIVVPQLKRIPAGARPYLSYIGFAGVIASLFVITATTRFPAPGAALPVLSTALVIAAFVGGDVRAVPHLTNPLAQYIGEVSYTLYLWHFPVIVLMAAVLPPGLRFDVLAVVLAMGLTAATYRFYENPIRRSKWLEPDHRPGLTRISVAVGVIATCVVAGSAVVLESAENRSANTRLDETLDVTAQAPKFDLASRCAGAFALTTPGCKIFDPSKPVFPSLDEFATDGGRGAFQCFRQQGEPFKSCTYGYKGPGAKRFAVVGDSHAAVLLPALSQYLVQNKWNMTTFIGYECSWILNDRRSDCQDMRSQTQKKLLADRYDLVVVSGSRQHSAIAGTVGDYVTTWQPVAAAGSKILVVADVPGVSPEAISCLTRVGSNLADCATPRGVAFATADPLPAAAQQIPGVTVLDMTNSFCVADECPSIIGNFIVYMDAAGHITATYGRTLAPQIVDSVKKLLG